MTEAYDEDTERVLRGLFYLSTPTSGILVVMFTIGMQFGGQAFRSGVEAVVGDWRIVIGFIALLFVIQIVIFHYVIRKPGDNPYGAV